MKKSSWLFMLILMMSTMMTLSSNNWMSMWIGLEMNMMSFMPIILKKVNKSSSEAAMIYFLIQTMSSALFMMMILIKAISINMSDYIMNNAITLSLLIKLGAAPFHYWLPKIMSNMNWKKSMILMTWQKLAPLMMIYNSGSSTIINLSTMCCIIIGSIGGMNQTSLRKLMSYSSINHMGWMMILIKYINLWMMYLMLYSIIMFMVTYMFSYYNIYYMNQLSMIYMNNTEKISFFFMMLSLGGLPPFIGFLPKWITMQTMMMEKEYFMMFIMIMFSLITLMFYTRIMMNMFMTFNSSTKWSFTKPNKYFNMLNIIMNLSLPLIMIMNIM
uniref:NADH-ubiquinone oxidoreductase chain 2 n=1 Tax=Pentatomidae sp. GM-2014 TaxID=1651278 RepID=A0A0A0VFZ7_9HEMI|nr:NADH dehydrogenase subunit 2 [Pentatomidae sp. GM-2014]AIW65020.1 NADH dehydrogenase subunit 2 [Pentatomidae sp. GM-2014]